MIKHSGAKFIYLTIVILTTVLAITGATYAYWTATTMSTENAVKTQSTIYSISMDITPLYQVFSLIPMNDEFALKGLKNECKDKYDRGACQAYKIRVYDYNENLNFISGYMDITTVGMENLSYMMYRISDEYNEDSCVTIGEKHYCIVREAAHMQDGVGLSLGDKYDVTGTLETEFILLIWLTNLNFSQNDTDIGDFNAVITMQAGNGGEIKGSIASVIKPETGTTTTPDNSTEETTTENGETTEGDSENGEGTE